LIVIEKPFITRIKMVLTRKWYFRFWGCFSIPYICSSPFYLRGWNDVEYNMWATVKEVMEVE
jgi:hypothetical protein